MAPKGCKLPSLMPHMINRRALFVVILLSALLFSGCSGVFGEDPGEQANQAIKGANASISEHNRLFDEARSTYKDVKQQIESGDDPSQEKDRITEAKNTLQDARRKLKDARESLNTVDGLDVDQKVKEYARLLSDAMEVQLAAEAKEVQFYDILEDDPALENNRERALDLLSEVGAGYREAEESYEKAQNLADSNPGLLEAPREGSG
jgi:DNA repair exonuclease SbcCD ATPase subunit